MTNQPFAHLSVQFSSIQLCRCLRALKINAGSHTYRESDTVCAGTVVAVRHDGSVSVAGREIVASNVVVPAQRHIVQSGRAVSELEGGAYAADDVTQPDDELDALVAHDGRRRRGKQNVADDVVELSMTSGRQVTSRSAARLLVVCSESQQTRE